MADITYFTDNAPSPNKTLTKGVITPYEIEVDFAVKNCASADRVKIMVVPAGSVVKTVRTIKKTLEGGALTVGIGDGTTATLFDAAVDLNAGLNTMAATDPNIETGLSTVGGKYYAAEGAIWLTLSAAADLAKALFSIEYYMLNEPYV